MIPNEVMTFDTLKLDDEKNDKTVRSSIDNISLETNDEWKFHSNNQIIHVNKETIFLEGCVYRGEGNANVVVALPYNRKVVRFRKSSCCSSGASQDGGRARTIREVEFLEYVISCFLNNFTETPEILRVTREDMLRMSKDIRSLRPEYRRLKEIVEEYATVFNDYAFLPQVITESLKNSYDKPTFCVEIKPKQGFRHEADDKFQKCTYCLMQYYKLQRRAIKRRSSYCPLDLFSGDVVRMRKSIRGLIESPQNNLKIFKDGVAVYDCNSDPNDLEKIFDQWFDVKKNQIMEEKFDTFSKIVCNALLRQFSYRKEGNGAHITQQDFQSHNFEEGSKINQKIVEEAQRILRSSDDRCNFTSGNLPSGSVLDRILKMQRLPYHSADVVYNIYSKHFTTLSDDAVYSKMINMYKKRNKVSASNTEKRSQRDFLTSSITRRKMSDGNGNKNNESTENRLPSFDVWNNNNKEIRTTISDDELLALENYLLATTAKDCSILIAFKKIDSRDVAAVPDDFVIEESDGMKFAVNIGVLDLDPKSIHCVEKHRQRDTNVLVSLINSQ